MGAKPASKQPGAIVLDIEGTVAPIAFVTEVCKRLFSRKSYRIEERNHMLLRDSLHSPASSAYASVNNSPTCFGHRQDRSAAVQSIR